MPPLHKILARLGELAQAKYADNREALGALGRVFTESADLNPNYFAVPGRVPEGDLAKLGAKHGVELKDLTTNSPYAGTRVRAQAPNGDVAIMRRERTMPEYLRRAEEFGDFPAGAAMSRAMKDRQLSLGTDLYGIDMMDAGKGKGSAKALYPPLYEWLLAQPDAANLAFSGLSMGNMTKRSQHMSGALEKFGDRAGHRLRIDNDQIAPVGDPLREVEYHRLPNDQKIGLLNAITAPNTVEAVNTQLRHLARRIQQGDPSALRTGLADEARSLGVHEGVWTPSTDVDANYIPRLTELLGDLTGPHSRVAGPESLRRAAITYDAVGGGLNAKDLAAQPYLTDRLARKTGGSVPGPLTQVCACGQHGRP